MRLSDRDRRLVLGALALVVVFTVTSVVVGALWPRDDAPKHALWMFGFKTVRVDADGSHGRKTFAATGFGDVVATGDRVWMYDAGSGEFGYLDAANGKITRFDRVATAFPGEDSQPDSGTIAVTADREWLVTAPGRVRPFTRDGKPAGGEVTLPGEGIGITRVVNAGGRVLAVYASGDATMFADVAEPSSVIVGGVAPAEVIGVSSDAGDVWVFTPTTAVRIDVASLRTTRISLRGAAPGGVGTAIATGGSIWAVARDHADLVRIDPRTGAGTARLRFLTTDHTFRPPTHLVAGLGDIWLLAPSQAEPLRRDARVVRVDPAGPTVTLGIDTPSSLFVGGIAVTSR